MKVRAVLVEAIMVLLCLIQGVQMCSANNTEAEKPLLAHISLSAPAFTVETVPDLQVHFSLKNTGKKIVNPNITASELVIDGQAYKESAFLFGNGPRDSRFSNLPPGDKIEFAYPLGHLFQQPGEHVLSWRGKNFNTVKQKVKVTRETNPWKIIATSGWAQVSAERAAYKSPTRKPFFVHVKIQNLSTRTVGFECTDRFQLFYPNQWAESQIPRRQVISEMRQNQAAFTPDEVSALIKLFHDTDGKTNVRLVNATEKKAMIKLSPGASYDYYLSFNAGGFEQLEKVKLPYAIIVMDGRIGLTDGNKVDTVRRNMNDSILGEIPLETPVQLRTIAPSANILFVGDD
jgi:hypothetical protein